MTSCAWAPRPPRAGQPRELTSLAGGASAGSWGRTRPCSSCSAGAGSMPSPSTSAPWPRGTHRGLRPAGRPVERGHQLAAQPLAKRVRATRASISADQSAGGRARARHRSAARSPPDAAPRGAPSPCARRARLRGWRAEDRARSRAPPEERRPRLGPSGVAARRRTASRSGGGRVWWSGAARTRALGDAHVRPERLAQPGDGVLQRRPRSAGARAPQSRRPAGLWRPLPRAGVGGGQQGALLRPEGEQNAIARRAPRVGPERGTPPPACNTGNKCFQVSAR